MSPDTRLDFWTFAFIGLRITVNISVPTLGFYVQPLRVDKLLHLFWSYLLYVKEKKDTFFSLKIGCLHDLQLQECKDSNR